MRVVLELLTGEIFFLVAHDWLISLAASLYRYWEKVEAIEFDLIILSLFITRA